LLFAAGELLHRRNDRLQKRLHRQMDMGPYGLKQAGRAKVLQGGTTSAGTIGKAQYVEAWGEDAEAGVLLDR
jgi:hypothetical protein